MGDLLIDLDSVATSWEPSNEPLIPSTGISTHYSEGSNPFDLIAHESAASFAAADDPFEVVSQRALQNGPPLCGDKLVSDPIEMNPASDSPTSLEPDPVKLSLDGRSLMYSSLTDIQPPDILYSSILDVSDYLDVTVSSVHNRRLSTILSSLDCSFGSSLSKEQSPRVSLNTTTLAGIPEWTCGSSYLLNQSLDFWSLPKNMSEEEQIGWIQKRMSKVIQDGEKQISTIRNSAQRSRSTSCISSIIPTSFSPLQLPNKLQASKCGELYRDNLVEDFDRTLRNKFNQESLSTSDCLVSLGIVKDKLSPSLTSSKASSDKFLNSAFLSSSSSQSFSNSDTPLESVDDDVFLASVPHPNWNLPELSDEECAKPPTTVSHTNEQVASVENLPILCLTDVEGCNHSISSPTLTPTLPLCEDTVRKLSLCSKYSPSRRHETTPRGAKISREERSKPMPVSGSQLVLRKPADKVKVATKGPLKAIVPVQNMTRKASLKPVSPKSASLNPATARRIPSPSPLKNKPKQPSTPVRYTRATMSQSPACLPTRSVARCRPRSPAVSHGHPSSPSSGSRAICPGTVPRIQISSPSVPIAKPRVSLHVDRPEARSKPNSIPGCCSPRPMSKLTSRAVPKENLVSKSSSPSLHPGGKPRVLSDVNSRSAPLKSPAPKASRLQQPSSRNSFLVQAGKENIG